MSTPAMLPILTADNAFYWDGTRQQQLLLQRCRDCGAIRHPPSPTCPMCRSLEWDTVSASGSGVVYSFVIPRHPVSEPFGSGYVIALIDLAEGPRFVANVDATDLAEVTIGAPVQMYFQPIDDGYHLPQFRLVGERR